MDIEIRRLRESDLDELREFFRIVMIDTFEKNESFNYEDEIEDELRTKERYLMQDVDSNGRERLFLLAVHEGKIVGTIGLYTANIVAVKLTEGAVEGLDEIGTIYIAPAYQNKGVGTLLLNAMLLICKSRQIERFCLDSGFGTAQQVWIHKFGQPAYHFSNYWGQDSHHMIWVIETETVLLNFKL